MRIRFTVLDPTGEVETREGAVAPRLSELAGKRLGILWNEKPNGDVLLSRLQETLEDRYGVRDTLWRQKGSSGPIPAQTLENLVQGTDFVLNAVAD